MYSILSGRTPFSEKETVGKTLDGIKKKQPNYLHPPWDKISEKAKNLVKRMLCKNPEKRITA